MSKNGKKLSNAFSTGSGGARFEAHIQANFATLMLSGGYAPCLRSWPIVEIGCQGKIDGYETDDVIVIVEDPKTQNRRKLLGQVKHAINVTKKDSVFAEVMQAAWQDFNNEAMFNREEDIIALITGPLSKTDSKGLGYLIEQALHTKSAKEFLTHVSQANFSSENERQKLAVIKHHLKAANNGKDVTDEELYQFLRHYRHLGYDLDKSTGVASSLLQSHIAQFNHEIPSLIWDGILKKVQDFNQQAGTITKDRFSEDILQYFRAPKIRTKPSKLSPELEKTSTATHWGSDLNYEVLVQASLLKSWDENKTGDKERISSLFDCDYSDWVKPLRETLQVHGLPISFNNGVWLIEDPEQVWQQLGSRVFDNHIEQLGSISEVVLSENDPAFELPSDERYAAAARGKVLIHSDSLRRGLAENLAFFANNADKFIHCSTGKVTDRLTLVIRNTFSSADWVLWGSLNNLLPTLAEVAPEEFLKAAEDAFISSTCPFDELFDQEDSGIFGSNYLTGLLWALESLAWDEGYIVRVCVLLAEIASRDPGGRYTNRPLNSLTEIMLPWLPQTLASIPKRQVAIKTVCREQPVVGWALLLSLLPDQHSTSTGTHKPKWRNPVPEDRRDSIDMAEYWQQSQFCADLAVEQANNSIDRQSKLVSIIDHMPQASASSLLEQILESKDASSDEKEYFPAWEQLKSIISKHRRFSHQEWSMSEERLEPLDKAVEALAPESPLLKHSPLFSSHTSDLIDIDGDWEAQHTKVRELRVQAIKEILEFGGTSAVIEFVDRVSHANDVGLALATAADDDIDHVLLPDKLDKGEHKVWSFISSYSLQRLHMGGWSWCDQQINRFSDQNHSALLLCTLPFCSEAWSRADGLSKSAKEYYWANTTAYGYEAGDDLEPAIVELLANNRPLAAIECLGALQHKKKPFNASLACDALLAAVSSTEKTNGLSQYTSIELIKTLQESEDTPFKKIFDVEWAYVPLLDRHSGASPKFLEKELSENPDYFCSLIKRIFRRKGAKPEKLSAADERIAANAYRLLDTWERLPGIKDDGSFNGDVFIEWVKKAEVSTIKSGRFDVAMQKLGAILHLSPQADDGFWIDHAIAGILNDRKHEELRTGYSIGVYNSRGVRIVDPSGEPERKLAEKYMSLTEETENQGYQRLAETLRSIASDYEREADHSPWYS